MAKKLVIVESPAKARTLARFLGSDYSIKASLGHIRDLPQWRLGVDVDKGFEPSYEVPRPKKAVVKELKAAAGKADSLYLATDPDREGEAISWHLVEVIKPDGLSIHRVAFHEITPEAVKEAFRHPRSIDMSLVQAQQARRILDRLVGYKISPLLGKKVQRGLSAGRVQSVALRMVVDREREIQGFVSVEYWSLDAELARAGGAKEKFRAGLVGLADGQKLEIPGQAQAEKLVAQLEGAVYTVAKVGHKEQSRSPAPPFITSTLQQEAWRRLGFTAQRTMALAQQLYEGLHLGKEGSVGLITYMRTDSTRVAASALSEARDYIKEKYGAEYCPAQPRHFARQVKGAQEAHEAIRPTRIHRLPDQVKPFLNREQHRLYELIWKRMVASQMAAARFHNTTVDIHAESKKSRSTYLFRATSSALRFLGFMALYSEGRDEAEPTKPSLPELKANEKLRLLGLYPEQHFTQPPLRYTEATLIKAMEENGIGRPSTYAPILSILGKREYVRKADGHFQPEKLGLVVADLLAQHFPDIVDVGFTASMEAQLDRIARGERKWQPVLQDFYRPFADRLAQAAQQIEKVAPEEVGEACPQCGQPLVIKVGRFGRFIACSGYPQCRYTRPWLLKVGVACPQCGGALVERRAKGKRPFYGCANYPQCRFTTNQRPLAQACTACGGLLTVYKGKRARCLKCGHFEEVAEKPEAVGSAS